MDRPENVKDLQTLMGFVPYLGKFMPNKSEVGSPLQLLEKNTLWKWESEQEKSEIETHDYQCTDLSIF